MDRIMPIELERAKLKKSLRGYDRSAVEELLGRASQSLQALIVENSDLREQVERQWRDLERTRLEENTLKDALILAQKAADETRSAAQKHADAILEEARQSALAEKVAMQQHVSEMRWEIERMKVEKKRFEDDFKALLDRYQRELSGPTVISVIDGAAAVGN